MPDGITKCLLASRACFARRRTVLRCYTREISLSLSISSISRSYLIRGYLSKEISP